MVYWIDHCVVCTNDVARWEAFFLAILGGTTRAEPPAVMRQRGIFVDLPHAHVGGFIATAPLPAAAPVGQGRPQYGFFVSASDISWHARRLDDLGAVRGEPVRSMVGSDPGVLLPWHDPDGNEFAFWAPDLLPEGAMTGGGAARVGRISHGVFEARDLSRTAALFEGYCDLERAPGLPDDQAVAFRLGGGGWLIYERVERLFGRTAGFGLPDPHTALLVPSSNFLAHYERLWKGLREWEHDVRADGPAEDPFAIEPCTVVHVSPAGRRCKAITGRGDDWFDWDTNLFHFYAGDPLDERFASYESQPIDGFLDELERSVSKK